MTIFHWIWNEAFDALSRTNPRLIRRRVAPRDPFARVLRFNKEFRVTFVRRPAFEPDEKLEKSVFHVRGLSEARIWRLVLAVARNWTKRPYGWATIESQHVTEVGLRLDYNNSPPRHANIVGWPTNREAQMSAAQRLAQKASLTLKE